MTGPDLSVLLVSWNTRDETLRCLDSLPAAAGDVACEVVAVDNGSATARPTGSPTTPASG